MNENLKFSQKAAEFLADLEDTKYKAYKDSGGKWTIGIGHLIKKGEEHLLRKILTRSEVIALLFSDIKEPEKIIHSHVRSPLNQQQYDALVLFVFNVGTLNFHNSTVLKELNEGDYADACRHLDDWVKVRDHKGVLKFCQGLQNRRDEEQELFLEGDYEKQR